MTRVPFSAQYVIKKAEGTTQEEFEKIKDDLARKLQSQLPPPRATHLVSQLSAFSDAEKKEKRVVEDVAKRLAVLQQLTNTKQEISISQLQGLHKSIQEIERHLESLQLSRERQEVQQIVTMKDSIKEAIRKSLSDYIKSRSFNNRPLLKLNL